MERYQVSSVVEARQSELPEGSPIEVRGIVRGLNNRGYSESGMFPNCQFFLQGEDGQLMRVLLNYAREQESYALSMLRAASETQKIISVKGTLDGICAGNPGRTISPRALNADLISLDDFFLASKDKWALIK